MLTQIKSVVFVKRAVRTIINNQVGWYVKKVMEWVVGGGGLHGCFREQGRLVGVQKCLE